MFPLPLARTVVSRLLDEIVEDRRLLAAGTGPTLEDIDRRIATLTELLGQLPEDFSRLRRLIRSEPDFQSPFPETRLVALSEHCTIALGVIDRLAGS